MLFDQVLNRVDQCYKRLLAHSTSSVTPGLNGAAAYNKSHPHQISASPTAHSPQWGYLNTVPIVPGTHMPGPGPTGALPCASLLFIIVPLISALCN